MKQRRLLTSSLMAMGIACVALVTVILPAEYNIDPTGIGEKLGLSSYALASQETPTTAEIKQSHAVDLVVPAGRGIEYKLHMAQFAKAEYEWKTQSDSLYVDLHGEPEGDTSGYFESYTIATVDQMKGSFTTPFVGSHGWYWKNTSDSAVTLTLNITGAFVVEGLKQ